MGELEIRLATDADELRLFTQKLLADLRALEQMLAEGRIESDRRRIGAEQEVFLVDRSWRPAPIATEVLEQLGGDPHFTTEVGRFNLEINLDPLELGGDCFSRLERELSGRLEQMREVARRLGAEVVMTGILPSLEKADLGLENMTPRQRYFALNEAMTRLRGEQYQFRIKGRDELLIRHDNVMLEACNTSFQVHCQVAPAELVRRYNLAQAVAAPVLAAAANSPLLFGRQLWRETRIALFQQSVDTRSSSVAHFREQAARVSFGTRWLEESVLEIFREDLARFRVLLGADVAEDPLAELRLGRVPQLRALRLYNGTVYRWNRPCYGISDGRPHLRIENRVLPAGPSIVDEVANAAFWLGLIEGGLERYGDIGRVMPFDAAEENFLAAARLGMGAQLLWPGRGSAPGETVPVQELILEELLPIAHRGLALLGILSADAERYLGVLEERVRSLKTGAMWLLDSWAALKDQGRRGERLAALVAATCHRQLGGQPVHTWEPARLEEVGSVKRHYLYVGQLMTTDLFTVNQNELVDLVAYVMNWKHIRHVPVEDDQHHLVGLVTHRSLLRLVGQNLRAGGGEPIPVARVMQAPVITVRPETTTLEAIALMRQHKVSCLPVVEAEGRLVGIVTERDFMGIAGKLLEEYLGQAEPAETGTGPAAPDPARSG